MRDRLFKMNNATLMRLILVLSGVLFFVALSHLGACIDAFCKVLQVLRPFFIGLAFAYLIDPSVNTLEQQGMKHNIAVLVSCAVWILLTAVVLILALPQLLQSLQGLVSGVPYYYSQLQRFLSWAEGQYGFDAAPILAFVGSYVELMGQGFSFLLNNLPALVKYSQAVGTGIFQFFSGSFVGLYMLLEKKQLFKQVQRLILALFSENNARKMLHVFGTAQKMLRRFVGGKLLACLVIWFLSFMMGTLLRIPYNFLISLVVGITSFVPILGPVIGGTFCCLLLLVLSPVKAVLYGVLLIVLQQLDSRVISRRIAGNATGLRTLWVLVAILIGGQIGGLVGIILSVPILGTIFAMTREVLDARLLRKGIDEFGRPLENNPSAETSRELITDSAIVGVPVQEEGQEFTPTMSVNSIEVHLDAEPLQEDISDAGDKTGELPKELVEQLLQELQQSGMNEPNE